MNMDFFEMIHPSPPEAFAMAAVERILAAMEEAIAQHGTCLLGLSGGKTPEPVYKELAHCQVDWSKVHVFLLDERYVPVENSESNQGMIRRTLIEPAAIPESSLTFPDTSLSYEECAAAYDLSLKHLLKRPADVIVLGMGEDGHTASLFPPLPDNVFDDDVYALATTSPTGIAQRISVSLPLIAESSAAFILLHGAKKKEVWEDMMQSEESVERWPLKAMLEGGNTCVIAS